ncbi:MAG TPA: AraC family transcriptional regulator [Pseudonocardia sp.]|nr:AraC family transcriptional regulator [Pseudonocardia sp.]
MGGHELAGELLASHRVARTADLGQIEAVLERVQPRVPVRLRVADDAKDFVLAVNAVDVGDITVSYTYSSVDLHAVYHPTRNYHVNMVIRGSSRWRARGSDELDSSAGIGAVANPGVSGEVLLSGGCAQLGVLLPPAIVEQELQRHLDRTITAPLRFQEEMSLTSSATAGWLDALRLVCRAVDREDPLIGAPMASSMLQNLLVDSLLLAQRHNYSEQLHAPTRTGSSRAVREAADLLHDRPEYAWSVGELAEQVHLSVRALQQAFRRDTGDSPMRYLRRVRLNRAHTALLASDPTESTVTDLAARAGFGHHGHFAAAYRGQFGESPSETLHRRADPAAS